MELLYDLTYVVAFAAAADQLAHGVVAGEVVPALGAYIFAVFAVSWAWMNFTWFSSAYGNDDALFRVATIVQMVGVIVLTFGLPVSFSAAAHGESPNNALMVIGYVIMRVPLIGLWLRAAREDAAHRRIAVAYAIMIAVAQVGWILTAVLPLPVDATIVALVVLAVAEMAAPVIAERQLGFAPWNAGHVAERFALLTIITIGEMIAATTAAVGALTAEEGWSVGAVTVITAGLVLAAALWWAYFLIPSRTILERWPERIFAWRYAHLPMFGSMAAVGAGLHIAAEAVEDDETTVLVVALALAIPVAAVIVTVFLTWSVLMKTYDLTHVPLFVAALVPLVAAVVVAASTAGSVEQATVSSNISTLVVVIALIAASAVIEVVGHELVGYRHTIRALRVSSDRVD
ncbi:low temperature requirement protein A [Micromonospora sp. DT81.3]|uniref:low temperature requirement protein A n=1 Tax=Micromonospora sp. DT81.3 TaxID=3416523 RepID=UPI003CE6FF97